MLFALVTLSAISLAHGSSPVGDFSRQEVSYADLIWI
jgi:hypothetical protein